MDGTSCKYRREVVRLMLLQLWENLKASRHIWNAARNLEQTARHDFLWLVRSRAAFWNSEFAASLKFSSSKQIVGADAASSQSTSPTLLLLVRFWLWCTNERSALSTHEDLENSELGITEECAYWHFSLCIGKLTVLPSPILMMQAGTCSGERETGERTKLWSGLGANWLHLVLSFCWTYSATVCWGFVGFVLDGTSFE